MEVPVLDYMAFYLARFFFFSILEGDLPRVCGGSSLVGYWST